MGRKPCCSQEGMNRGSWTASEDKILTDYIKLHGQGKWSNIPKEASLKRCGKSCRLRWMNYLRPDIKRGNISSDEEDLIIRLHKLLGNRWSLIAGRLPGRTDNEIKNYWNTHLSKRGQDKEPRPKPKPNRYKVVDDVPIKSCVIRTKASRCTDVFLTRPDYDQQHRTENHDRNVAAETEPSTDVEESCLDFMVEFSGGEITTSASEIFASDFTAKLSHDLGDSEMDNVMLVDHGIMEQNWRCGSDDYNINIQANLDSDFGSLVDFIESADEWII